MAVFDWDKWNIGWSFGLPKNEMWAKIRDGKNDESGKPTFRYEEKSDTSSADPIVAGVIAEHRFVSPAVSSTPEDEHCFCGWSGENHVDHLHDKVVAFFKGLSEKPVKKAKKSDSGDE